MDYYRSFQTPSVFAQEFLFFTDGLGHLKNEGFIIDRENFNNNLIMYVLSGTLHVEQNGHYVLKQGEGIIMNLIDRHKYYTDETDTCEIIWIHFNGRQCDAFLKFIADTHKMPAVFKDTRVAEHIRNCFLLTSKDYIENEYLISQNIYSSVLSVLNFVHKQSKLQNLTSKTKFKNKAIRYINNNIYNKITLNDFAQHFYISEHHFCRKFHQYFNMPPIKYIMTKKIELSKYLLSYTNDSISSIAIGLGFTDQSHFSKTFKALQDISPLEYRRK